MARSGTNSDAYPETGPYIGNPPPDDGGGGPPPSDSSSMTDDQIKAMFPAFPWASLADGGKAICAAVRNGFAAGWTPAQIANAAFQAFRQDTFFQTWAPGFDQWATYAGADPGSYESLTAYKRDVANAAIDIAGRSDAWQRIFSSAQIALLKSGKFWENPQLFAFSKWLDVNLDSWTNPQYLSLHGAPTFSLLWNAFQNQQTGVQMEQQWRDTQSDQRSAASQAEAEARQEANRKEHITTAASRIVQGYDPSITGLFTQDELNNASIWDAGGEWGDGKASKLLALAGPLNQLFMAYYGRPITRAELDQYYASGATPEIVNNQLQSAGIQKAFQPSIAGLFSQDEIKAYSDQQAGISTPNGANVANLVNLALNLDPIYQQYQGRHITREELNAALANGATPQSVAGQFGGQAWVGANKGDVQYYAGAFGEGQLSADQLQQLGANEAGYTTPQGQLLQANFEKAVARARSAFGGVVAHLERNNQFGQQGNQLPDIAA